jgi:CRISPR-associated protein Csb2
VIVRSPHENDGHAVCKSSEEVSVFVSNGYVGGCCRWRVQIARYVPIIVIDFLKPVSGPIAVGYGAHFGLGLFVPV